MPTIRESLETAVAGLANEEHTGVAGGAEIGFDAVDAGAALELPAGDAAAAQDAGAAAVRARDEIGRFTARDAIKAQAAAAGAQDLPAGTAAGAPTADGQGAPAPTVDPRLVTPPASWKAENRAKWESVDPEVRSYIHQREDEMARGVEPLKRVWNTLTPYMPLIQQSGRAPEAVVGDIMETVARLRTGDPQSKFDLWMNIGKSYGVPVHQLAAATGQQGEQQQLDPQVVNLMTQVQQLQGFVGDFQQQQVHAVNTQAQGMISEFGKTHPHMDQVGPIMGRLIAMGEAENLDQAYDKAIRLHDGLWQQQQAKQREADAQAQRQAADKAAKAARRSAVSTRSATPGAGAAANANSNTTDRRSLIAEQVGAMRSGRI